MTLHEALHALGIVPSCAPNHALAGHVSTPPSDLMYAGNQSWDTAHMVLDAGNDVFIQHSQGNCPDLADSAFMDAVPGTPSRASSPLIPAPPVTPPPVVPPATADSGGVAHPPRISPAAFRGFSAALR